MLSAVLPKLPVFVIRQQLGLTEQTTTTGHLGKGPLPAPSICRPATLTWSVLLLACTLVSNNVQNRHRQQ